MDETLKRAEQTSMQHTERLRKELLEQVEPMKVEMASLRSAVEGLAKAQSTAGSTTATEPGRAPKEAQQQGWHSARYIEVKGFVERWELR
eukprot:3898522-Lingulodinium_polyedra.AAC.1